MNFDFAKSIERVSEKLLPEFEKDVSNIDQSLDRDLMLAQISGLSAAHSLNVVQLVLEEYHRELLKFLSESYQRRI